MSDEEANIIWKLITYENPRSVVSIRWNDVSHNDTHYYLEYDCYEPLSDIREVLTKRTSIKKTDIKSEMRDYKINEILNVSK